MFKGTPNIKLKKVKKEKEHVHVLLNPGTHCILKILAAHAECSVSQLVQAAINKMIFETKENLLKGETKDGKKDKQ